MFPACERAIGRGRWRRFGRVAPSDWVTRFALLVPAGEPVLDVACGGGRHTRFFRGRGHPVTAVDRDTSGLADLAGDPGLELVEADLEAGDAVPFAGRTFGAVVVTNYLHRPILGEIVAAVAGGGVLLYETFALGQERFGRPQNPAFLLRPGELLEAVRGVLRVAAYEDLVLGDPEPRAVQRIAAVRP
ncbi:MAG TPA: methyltransferase domain-containing protein [Acidimicrobiia bacterium]|nr:methyltransferase domain-containing protein [Acidimicrobiia bacterium]